MVEGVVGSLGMRVTGIRVYASTELTGYSVDLGDLAGIFPEAN